jgi:hypothetical protein
MFLGRSKKMTASDDVVANERTELNLLTELRKFRSINWPN